MHTRQGIRKRALKDRCALGCRGGHSSAGIWGGCFHAEPAATTAARAPSCSAFCGFPTCPAPVRCALRLSSPYSHPFVSARAYAKSSQLPSVASGATDCTACAVRTYSAQACTHLEGAEEDEDDYLQAYEELLMQTGAHVEADGTSQPGDPEAEGMDHISEEAGADVDAAFPPSERPASVLSPADTLVEETLAALPANGSVVLLTDLTSSLDVEAISTLFGSVLSFLQLYPHCFTCTQNAKTSRWQVARSRSSIAPLDAVAAAAVAPTRSPAVDGSSQDGKATLESLDVVAMVLDEELMRVRGTRCTSKTGTRVAEAVPSVAKRPRCHLTPVAAPYPPVPSSAVYGADKAAPLTATDQAWWPLIARLLPEDGTPLSISVLRASLPESIVQELRARQVGLARFFKQSYATASRDVALTADATALVRVTVPGTKSAAAASVSLWSPTHQYPSTPKGKEPLVMAFSSALSDCEGGSYVPPPADYDTSHDAEPWLVTIPLDEGECTAPEGEPTESAYAEEAALPQSVDAAAALEAATGLQQVLYSGLGGAEGPSSAKGQGVGLQPHDLDLERLRDAPAPPKAPAKGGPSTATQLPGPAAPLRKARPPRPSTPAEWLALHTAMAEERGWITPMQMLDYLVECVPTFYIPVDELRPSDAILKLVGARTSIQTLVCRVYVYFIERSEDKMQVRLAPTVEHAQRGAANVHYAAFNPETMTEQEQRGADGKRDAVSAPADAGNGTSPTPGDSQRSVAHDAARGGGAVLQASEATKAFPVMRIQRPIKSEHCLHSLRAAVGNSKGAALPVTSPTAMRRSSLGEGAGVSASAGKSCPPTILKGNSGVIALSSVPTNEIGYPFLSLATQPADTWPWWARLLCVLPFDTYVPLDHLCIHYCPDLTPANVHLAWKATEASSPPTAPTDKTCTPIPLALLRAPTTSRKVRLRPFWLSPGCTAELEGKMVPAGLVKQLRPAWVPVSRVIAKLTSEAREESLALAARRPSAAGLSAEEALVMLLRDCGRFCWVQEDGTKVRTYAASSALDDHFHASLSLLYGFSSARVWAPLPELLDRASEHVRIFFAHSRTPPFASPNTVGLIGMLRQAPPEELKAFITRHSQWLEVKETNGGEAGDKAATQLHVRRRAALISFGGERERGCVGRL
ncbi:hypothetical protein LSCM1_06792 [Leishmania martiniquensis]|uniref:Uncharacterized protein n=1 Tax=Leishmania martiniquensis TaxID=1580590 RepID=A0A836GTM8_9TRYP|nr:hypothetical protein LSCM1_06792 [Leishmania martiniquensis]